MTIEQLENLGDFLAAIATIITLIYLAFQIRQNTSLLRLSEVRGVQDDADRWQSLLIQSKEVALETPYSRQTAVTDLPPSTSFSTFTICDSVNRDLRIVLLIAFMIMAENSKLARD